MQAVDEVAIAEPILDYILDLVAATRSGDASGTGPFFLGASPRAALDLDRAARARALLDGRDFVLPDDVHQLVVPVLAHRLIPAETGYDGQSSSTALLTKILETVPPPRLGPDGNIDR